MDFIKCLMATYWTFSVYFHYCRNKDKNTWKHSHIVWTPLWHEITLNLMVFSRGHALSGCWRHPLSRITAMFCRRVSDPSFLKVRCCTRTGHLTWGFSQQICPAPGWHNSEWGQVGHWVENSSHRHQAAGALGLVQAECGYVQEACGSWGVRGA